jgi:hypothetical protein
LAGWQARKRRHPTPGPVSSSARHSGRDRKSLSFASGQRPRADSAASPWLAPARPARCRRPCRYPAGTSCQRIVGRRREPVAAGLDRRHACLPSKARTTSGHCGLPRHSSHSLSARRISGGRNAGV